MAAFCAATVFADGYDAQAIGFVAPTLVEQWHITRSALSPVFSGGLVGMFIGALLFGPLGDRFGRKRVLVWCTLWFGVLALFTGMAQSVTFLTVLRFTKGLGLGGTLPNAIALTSECMPKRLRATGVMLMFMGFSLGAATGGIAAAGLISHFGWQSVFLVGGILPCLTATSLLRLPNSIGYLGLQDAEMKRTDALDSSASSGSSCVTSKRTETGFLVAHLFRDRRTSMTLLLWLIFFMSLLDLYFINSWLPTVIHDSGVAIEKAVVMTSLFQIGGAVGVLILGCWIDHKASYDVLAWTYVGAAATVFLIGIESGSFGLETVAIFAAGVCVIGGQTAANALAAESYPPQFRSTGVGWALGIGRIGSIIGPIVGGALLSLQWETKWILWSAAVPPLIAAVAATALNSMVGRASVPVLAAQQQERLL